MLSTCTVSLFTFRVDACSSSAAGMQTAVQLRGVLPVVVDADVWEDAGEALDDMFIPDAEIWYSFPPNCMARMAS